MYVICCWRVFWKIFSIAVAEMPGHVVNWLCWMALMSVHLGGQKDTAGDIIWGILWKWFGRSFRRTVFRLCLCGRGDFLAVIWDLVVGSTISSTFPVSLATLFCCCIGFIICIYRMIFFSQRCITSWWILKRCGLGLVRRVPVWMPRGGMVDLSFLYVYITVSYNLLYLWLRARLLD